MSAPKTKCGGCGEYIYGTHTPYDCIDALRSALEQAQRERDNWHSIANDRAAMLAKRLALHAEVQAENARLREFGEKVAEGVQEVCKDEAMGMAGAKPKMSGLTFYQNPTMVVLCRRLDQIDLSAIVARVVGIAASDGTDALDEYGKKVAEAVHVACRDEAWKHSPEAYSAIDALDLSAILKGARG